MFAISIHGRIEEEKGVMNMDRLEQVRERTDEIIAKLSREEDRKFAYLHSYGVAQSATFLASIRDLDVELAGITAMLHDIAVYAINCPHAQHAQKSAELAKTILEDMNVFQEDEIIAITNAIAVHSNKMTRTDSRFAELIKDSDVLQHYLYNPMIPLQDQDKFRLFYLLEDMKKIKEHTDK